MKENQQKPEPRAMEDTLLDVHSIFYTIQGEGPFSGCPAHFIRLAGCNLQCPGCDTEYTATRRKMSVLDVVGTINTIDQGNKNQLVVLTGGEPLRQDLTALVNRLQENGYYVQIETNGTFPPSPKLPPCAIVCSPKAGKVHPALIAFGILAYKYVGRAYALSDEDGLPLSVLGSSTCPARPHKDFEGDIYLSPMDEQDAAENTANKEAVVNACLKHGHTLNLQIHKLVGLP